MDSKSDHQHVPVMLNEAVSALVVSPTGTYLDATYGAGGHSSAILDRLDEEGSLLALDCDGTISASERCASDKRFTLERLNFARMDEAVPAGTKLDGVLMDLGISSMHVDDPARGFSFAREGPLDMRMDDRLQHTLQKRLMHINERELADVIYQYGEERRSRQIAKRIIELRKEGKLNSTTDLARVCGAKRSAIHPATRMFLALRIWVNDELKNLELGLMKAAQLLRSGGRLVVISFHSIEDRIVKRFIGPKHNNLQPLRPLGRAVHPSKDEYTANRRARSALLRVAFKP